VNATVCDRPAGFTLLEVLIVLVIIGVMSALVAVVAFPNNDALSERDARRLANLLELAFAEARATGQSIAWGPEESGYSFWYQSSDLEWSRFPDSSVFKRRTFSEETEIERVYVDGRELSPGGRIIVRPHGTQGVVEVRIVGASARFVIRGGAFGRISLRREQESGTGTHAAAGA